MVTTSPIEPRTVVESQPTRPDPSSGNSDEVARQSTKPDFVGAASRVDDGRPSDDRNTAYSVAISDEAHKLAASAAQDDEPSAPRALETAAPTERHNGVAPQDDPETNQTTSFESERRGNDTQNATEAGRTLGQVIDAYA